MSATASFAACAFNLVQRRVVTVSCDVCLSILRAAKLDDMIRHISFINLEGGRIGLNILDCIVLLLSHSVDASFSSVRPSSRGSF